jgi:hypothetical protein
MNFLFQVYNSSINNVISIYKNNGSKDGLYF